MLTEKTKKTLSLTLIIIGLTLAFGAMICIMISDFSDALPKNDLYRTTMLLGWAIAWLGSYYQPISINQLENGPGCFLTLNVLLLIILPLGWIRDIEHFTTPVVIMLAISAVLFIVDFVLIYKKYRQIKALTKEDENEKKEG